MAVGMEEDRGCMYPGLSFSWPSVKKESKGWTMEFRVGKKGSEIMTEEEGCKKVAG